MSESVLHNHSRLFFFFFFFFAGWGGVGVGGLKKKNRTLLIVLTGKFCTYSDILIRACTNL